MALSKSKRIFGWIAGNDGCGFYRLKQPLSQLADANPAGYATSCDTILPRDFMDYDVIIGQRVCEWNEVRNPVEQFGNLSMDHDQLTVYELDDNLWELPEDNPAHTYFSEVARQENMRACCSMADMVIVSTEPLAEVVRKYNPHVIVIPNYIDEDVLKIERPKNERVIIGWGGTSTHKQDFDATGDALDRIILKFPQTTFMTIGSLQYGQNLPRGRIFRKKWIMSTRKVYQHIAQFDIGIAPLAENVFNESKSWIKALEYAALGIPCVAGNFGPYRDLIRHGETGFLASTPKEWTEYLSLLVSDEELRLKMGACARRQAEELTIQGQIWRYEDAFRG